ncbi:DedA family protein [Streptacidiphilus monticola]|uniref:DedA family protein n=1 Tax=Streptacidiphilus monticola TaxID=2161674 RepID=A0ABW1G2Z2_9ACTN
MAPDPTGTHQLAVNLLDANSLLAAFGAIGILVVLFAETGLLVGFFLPGDSLLFTAGLLCTTSKNGVHLNLASVLVCAVAGALIGAQVGYVIGRKGGRALLNRSSNKHLQQGAARAEEILAKYGYAKAIVLARFIPVVRTVLNPMAGALNVPVRTFTLWQVVGGLLWSVGVTLAGYALGSSIPSIDKYLLPIIALIVVISVIPIGLELLRARRRGAEAAADADAASTPGPQAPGAAPTTSHHRK